MYPNKKIHLSAVNGSLGCRLCLRRYNRFQGQSRYNRMFCIDINIKPHKFTLAIIRNVVTHKPTYTAYITKRRRITKNNGDTYVVFHDAVGRRERPRISLYCRDLLYKRFSASRRFKPCLRRQSNVVASPGRQSRQLTDRKCLPATAVAVVSRSPSLSSFYWHLHPSPSQPHIADIVPSGLLRGCTALNVF